MKASKNEIQECERLVSQCDLGSNVIRLGLLSMPTYYTRTTRNRAFHDALEVDCDAFWDNRNTDDTSKYSENG